jgi:hypothetical protein
MTGTGARPRIRPRRQDRNRRVRSWAACVAAGAVVGAFAGLLAGGGPAMLLILLGGSIGAVLGHRFMIAPPGVAILTYHSVSPDPAWLPWSREIAVHPDTLRAHLETMRRMGCTILSSRRFIASRLAGEPLPDRAVVLHFDDGYLDNWLFAAPLLREAKAPATFFASLDFIDPTREARTARPGQDVRGYMNWAELEKLEQESWFEVEPHGIDHGRVPVSDRQVDTVTARNWRSLAWLQWGATPGPKHDWYLAQQPTAVPIGAPVPESEGALAAPALWESQEEYRARVEQHLGRCMDAFEARLGIVPQIFCWPENRVSAAARTIASRLGYAATTGGTGRNSESEPAYIMSRIHAGDRALGFRWPPAERLRIRAGIRLFQGNHYWYLVTAPMDLIRRLVMALRNRMGSHYA